MKKLYVGGAVNEKLGRASNQQGMEKAWVGSGGKRDLGGLL